MVMNYLFYVIIQPLRLFMSLTEQNVNHQACAPHLKLASNHLLSPGVVRSFVV